MKRFRKLLFPLLTLCFVLLLAGYALGRGSRSGPVLSTQRSPAPAESAQARSLPSAPTEPVRIELNRAGLEELMTLPGIGQTRAERILAYRQAHGAFKSAAELMEVAGIGEGIFAEIRDLVYVEESRENTDH